MTYDELYEMTDEERLKKYLEMKPLIDDIERSALWTAEKVSGRTLNTENIKIGDTTCKYSYERNTSCGCCPEYETVSGEFPVEWIALEQGELYRTLEAKKSEELAAKTKLAEEIRLREQENRRKAAEEARVRQEEEELRQFEVLKQKYGTREDLK